MIDFEQKFRDYIENYTANLNEDEIEKLLPQLYLEWADTPASWLLGATPNSYFSKMDPTQLVKLFGEYLIEGSNVPGQLLNSIVDKEQSTYPLLVNLLINYDGEGSDDLKNEIVRLLSEMGFKHPFDYYIGVIKSCERPNSFCETCAEMLKEAGEQYKAKILEALNSGCNRYAQDCFLDILASMPFCDKVFEHVLERFLLSEDGKAFYANLLGKLGNEKAVPYLLKALRLEEIGYYDYVAVCNALEALGKEIKIERDFSGDKDYDRLVDGGD